jgi:hypothetical protein
MTGICIMRTVVSAVAFATSAVASVPACAQPVGASVCDGGDRKSCSYIVAATAELTSMLTTANPAPLRRHLDREALWISSAGQLRTGAQLMAFVARDVRRATARLDRVSVRFFGDVAIVTWKESWTAPGTTAAAGRLGGVDTWAKRRGRWRIIATVEAHLAP